MPCEDDLKHASSLDDPGSASQEKIEDERKDEVDVLPEESRRAAERKLVRKLDCRLMPTVVVIYLLNYLDRVAVTSARLQGLERDLKLSDVQYDAVVAVLFASYCPAQIPSNIIISYISRPSLYIGACVVAWGLTSALSGATHNFIGLLLCRIFIGLPEAAFYPGCSYLLSRWYTKKELAFRSAIFYEGQMISNAFGSLAAAGILGNMEGALGIAAWRWLFYIEGAITMFFGFQVMWLLPDWPDNTRWLSKAELRLAQVRLAEDAGEADKDADVSILEGFKLAIRDPKVPLFMLMQFAELIGLGFVNFFPTLVGTLGFSTTTTLLLCAPPWIVAGFLSVGNAWIADKRGDRFWSLAIWWWICTIGYIIGLSTMSTGGRYFYLFCLCSGYVGFALTLAWVSNAVPRPPAKRSAAIGLVNGFGNTALIVSSFMWKADWGPQYQPSMIISIAAMAFAFVLACIIRYMLVQENKKMDRDELEIIEGPERERIEEAARLEGISFDEAVRRRKGFRYLT
ncbi:MFS general substrate transporter [Coniophora puteana RWD-64-598 SS2]|uniref:MFS general substrate transporter n=1 Tax=Coniophora puteana (strain RWD-64-598) TaxID=741705 RepID=A0A5M3MN66_CONPW|nr:MFS general substrate transporter [Coniophora puteana RWD-64-598 SS2]EIW80619.1 MFS general substrate transporter [Coniophora puteana RWD-64-598 SS2]